MRPMRVWLLLVLVLLLLAGTSRSVLAQEDDDEDDDDDVDDDVYEEREYTEAPTEPEETDAPTLPEETDAPTFPDDTDAPSKMPTMEPTFKPTTARPTAKPVTPKPTKVGVTLKPSKTPTTRPSKAPVLTPAPSRTPTRSPRTSRPSRAPATKRPSRSPVTSRPSRSPVTKRPTRSPVPRPSRAPTTSPSNPTPYPTLRPTKPAPTGSPTIDASTVTIDQAKLDSKMVLTVYFNSPVAFYNATAVNNRPVKRIGCAVIFSAPEFTRPDGKEVFCRVSGDGLSVYSDALRTSVADDYSQVVTRDGFVVSVAGGNARMGSLWKTIIVDDFLTPKPVLELQESSCGNIYVSWKKSTGNVNKPFESANWVVTGTPAAVADEMAQSMNALMRDMTETVLSRFELDSRGHGRRFVARLNLTNWLSQSGLSDPVNIDLSRVTPSNANGNATTAITIVGTPVIKATVPFGEPEYILNAPKEVDMRSDFVLEVAYAFPVERCSNAGQEYVNGTRYPVWQALEGPFPRGFKGQPVRGDTFKYLVMAGQLGVGTYKFGVQVSRYQTLTTTLIVSMDATLNIWGGNRSVIADETTVLRLDDAFAPESVASIKWVCRYITLIGAGSEDEEDSGSVLDSIADPQFFFQPTSACSGAIVTALNRGRGFVNVEVPSTAVSMDRIFVIRAEFQLYPGGPTLQSLPAYLLRTSAVGGFSVQIDMSTQPIAGRGKLNVNSATVIRIQSQEKSLRYSWSQMEGDLDEDTLDSLGLERSYLRIPANTLSPGQRYAFRVSVTNVPNLFATISFVGNESPSGGFLGIGPSEGLSGVTDFTLQALYFSDEDLPLAYSFVIARRNCFEEDCYVSRSIFKTVTPFVPDSAAVTKLEYYSKVQTLGCIAQDALGAMSAVVLANSTVLVKRPPKSQAELVSDLREAVAKPEEGAVAWNNILAALSNFHNDSTTAQPAAVEPELLQQALKTAEEAANYAPQRMSSLVIEGQISARIATEFKGVLESNPAVLESTVQSIGSVLERAKTVLGGQQSQSSLAEGDAECLRSLTEDTLASTSALLDTLASSDRVSEANVSVPRDVLSRLIQVQLAVPIKAQSAEQERFFSSSNIETSFVAKFQDDIGNGSDSDPVDGDSKFFAVKPSLSLPNTGFTLPAEIVLNQLGENSTLAFVSSIHYRINPFAKEAKARNQSLAASGVTSLQVYDGSTGSRVSSFETPLQIRLDLAQGSHIRTNPEFARTLQGSRIVNSTDPAKPPRNVTERIYCGFWDYEIQKWSDFGCSIQSLGSGVITCQCNHTTDYAAWVETINEIVLTFTDVSNFNDIRDGIAVLIVVGLWFIGTVLFLIWGYYLDDRDMKRRVRSILFSLKLKKLRDRRVKHRVFRAWRDQVMKESGALVDSSVPLPPALSSIVSIERRNRKAVAPPPELQVDLSTTPKRMWHFFNVSLIREHTLMNTIFLLDPFLTRPMRVLCGAAVILGEMFAAAVFYHFETSDDITIGTQIAVALLCIVLVSPVVALFVILSRRVAAIPGAQRLYLQQMMVVLIAEMGEDRRGDDVQSWAKFAKHVTWDDLKEIHRFQSMRARLDIIRRQQQTPEVRREIKSLQHELAVQKQTILETLHESNPDFGELNKERVNRKDIVSQKDHDSFDLDLSSNTTRWLAKVSSSAPASKKSGLLSPLNSGSSKKSDRAFLQPKSPRILSAFTPRPFKAMTPRRISEDEDEDDDIRIKARNCLRRWFVRPIFWLIRARPTSWYRSNMPPPESDFYLSHKWIYLSYIVLFLYYALALFYTISWGFRSKTEGVLNWLPTVAFSIFIDLCILQPFLIFVRYVVMNEIAFRMDEHEFVSTGYTNSGSYNRNVQDRNVQIMFDGLKDKTTGDEAPHDIPIQEPIAPPPRPKRNGKTSAQQQQAPPPPQPPPTTDAMTLV